MSLSLAITSPGAIPDLPALTAAISDWLDRADTDAKVPQFIQLAEAMFNREIRSPEMERTTTTLTGAEDTLLPDDYLAMRAIYEEGSPDIPLKGISPTAIRDGFSGGTGTPIAYCLVSGGIRLVPPPASQITLRMDYFAQIEPLSIQAPSNWLLLKHPDAYLYGTLFYAESFFDNATRAAQWKGLLNEVVARINRTSRNDRYGAGPLVPHAAIQVRAARC